MHCNLRKRTRGKDFTAQQGSGGGNSGQSGIDPNTGEVIGIGNPRNNGKFRTAPKVPMCYAESVASTLISRIKTR